MGVFALPDLHSRGAGLTQAGEPQAFPRRPQDREAKVKLHGNESLEYL